MTTSTPTPADKDLPPQTAGITLAAQHQRDLEILGRIEHEQLCWFCSMERLHAQQKREAGLG